MFRLLPFSLDHSGLWCRSLLLCVAWWSCLEGDRGAASPGVCSVAGAGCHPSQQMGLSPGHSQPWEQVAENSQLATCSQGWPGWRSQTGCFIPTFSGGSHAAPQKGKQVGISMGFAFCQAVCFYLPMSQNITNNFSRWPDLLPAVLWRGTVGEWDLLARSCSTGSLFWNLLTVHSQVLAARLGQDALAVLVPILSSVSKLQFVLQPPSSLALNLEKVVCASCCCHRAANELLLQWEALEGPGFFHLALISVSTDETQMRGVMAKANLQYW